MKVRFLMKKSNKRVIALLLTVIKLVGLIIPTFAVINVEGQDGKNYLQGVSSDYIYKLFIDNNLNMIYNIR